MSTPRPAVIEWTQQSTDPVTGETSDDAPQKVFAAWVDVNQTDSGTALTWDDDDYQGLVVPEALEDDGDGGLVTASGNYRVRKVDPYDAVVLSPGAGVPQPLAAVRAAILRGDALATELDAVVAADNTVVTLLLETGVGTFVRYGGDWRMLDPNSDALDDLSLVRVGPGALDVFDTAENARTTITAFDLPVPSSRDNFDFEEPETITAAVGTTDEGVPILASVTIPEIHSAEDLDIAIRFAQVHPEARWYVMKKARAFGAVDQIPKAWQVGLLSPPEPAVDTEEDIVVTPSEFVLEDQNLKTPNGVQAAARYFVAMASAGATQVGPTFGPLVAAARYFEMLDHPDVILAAKWQEWLHPRGKDGKFIQVFSAINVFQDVKASLNDPKAHRRRAKVLRATPEGLHVQYFDPDGNPIGHDPENGYPDLIPLDEIAQKVSVAPPSLAKVPKHGRNMSAQKEYDTALGQARSERAVRRQPTEAMTQEQYDAAIADFNASLRDKSASYVSTDPETGEKTTVTMTDDMVSAMNVAPGSAEQLSDDEFKKHSAYVGFATSAALGHASGEHGVGLSSSVAFTDAFGRWSDDEVDRMAGFVDQIYDEVTIGKPKGRKGLVLGGLPGAGKSSILKEMSKTSDFNEDRDWITVNPDLIKERMWAEGWYPQVEGLGVAETAGFTHAQSAEMAQMLERRLLNDGYNIIFDETLGQRGRRRGGGNVEAIPDHLTDRFMRIVNEDGYDLDGIFADTTIDASLESVKNRHRRGTDAYRTGRAYDRDMNEIDVPEKKVGGRYVPDSVIAGASTEDPDPKKRKKTRPPSQFATYNEENFSTLMPIFKRWATYDGSQSGTGAIPKWVDGSENHPGTYPPGTFEPGTGGGLDTGPVPDYAGEPV